MSKINYSPILDLDSPFHDLLKPYRFKTLYGGRASMKSWSVAEALVRIAQCANVRILCVRMTQNSIADSVHKLLCDTIERLGFSSDFEITKVGITSKTGSTFFFKGIQHDAVNLKSLEGIDICWAEESATISEEGWRILLPTIRKEGSEIWQTFNTGNETDYTYQQFVLNPPPNSIVHLVNYDSNPFLPDTIKAEIEYCKEQDYELYKHIWLGQPLKLSDAVIFKNKFVVQDFEAPSNTQFRHGIDHGYTDTAACVRCYVQDEFLYVDYEAGGTKIELDDLPEVLLTIPTLPRWILYAESADPKANMFLKRRGFNMKPVKKGPNSILDGISYLKSFRQIIVHSRCKQLIEELKTYSWQTDKITREIIPVPTDKNNHYIDSLRYALEEYALKSSTSAKTWGKLAGRDN